VIEYLDISKEQFQAAITIFADRIDSAWYVIIESQVISFCIISPRANIFFIKVSWSSEELEVTFDMLDVWFALLFIICVLLPS
jgi:hypothetical protein